jgi:hypothetical protein
MNESLAARFLGAQPGANAGVSVQRDVALKLGGEIMIHLPAASESAKTHPDCSQLAHEFSPIPIAVPAWDR